MRARTLVAIAMAIPSLSVHAAVREAAPPDHAAHDAMPADVTAPQPDHAAHGAMPADGAPAVDHSAHLMHMTGALGPYAMTRDASGTAWQPESTPMEAIQDRKSTRLNSSHSQISYAVFCLKKKNT